MKFSSGQVGVPSFRSDSDRYVYLFDSPPQSKDLLILMRMDREQQKPPNPFVRLFTSLLTILGILFAFSSAMSVLIARSITRSVTVLEEAIADGVADDQASRMKSVEIIGAKVDQLEADAELLGRNADCRIDLPAEPTVPMDERLATRALENPANNALRYTAEGGRIGMRVYLGAGDRACGFAENFRSLLSRQFLRREQGLGLGLSVVKSFSDSHGWELEVESTMGSGNVFRIRISS